ncbi:Thioredoxin-like 3-3, partial [Glycine soja]
SNEQDKAKKGLEGTGIDLPINRRANLKSATSDDDFTNFFSSSSYCFVCAVIKYGATWCPVCIQILPAFCRLSNNFPKLTFVYTDINECSETTQHIRYTPTFQFYRNGEKVDEMFGAGGEERLHDRLWLHS